MYSKITSVILVLIFTAIGVSAQEKAKTSEASKDETMIRASVEQMAKGWNAKSGAEFAKPFAEDADYVVINGMQIKGRAVIDKGHQDIFDTIYKNSTLAVSVEQLRYLRPDVAIVHVLSTLSVTQENSTRSHNAKITLVMTKNKDKWEIAAFQNTQIQAPGNQSPKN
ncbi:MAG TPA: SgcJ/EcaC family oxidoreductase [Pyrinomonadaceae bacterium]|jgi:uncharacterized protein (TIGR02246 family)